MDRKIAAQELFESIPSFRRIFKGVKGGHSSHNHQQMVLHHINYHSGQAMKVYADKMHIAKSNFTKIVDCLIADGFIERVNDPEDRRKIKLMITEKGKTKVVEDKKCMVLRLENRLSILDDEDVEILIASLKNLERIANKMGQEDKKDA